MRAALGEQAKLLSVAAVIGRYEVALCALGLFMALAGLISATAVLNCATALLNSLVFIYGYSQF